MGTALVEETHWPVPQWYPDVSQSLGEPLTS
jgi:hypothetical protein